MKGIKLIIVFAVSAFLASCAVGPKVFYDYDPDQSFTQYKTFSWVSDNPMTVTGDNTISPLMEDRLQTSIKTLMESKGYQYVEDKTSADVSIGFTLGSREKVRVNNTPIVTAGAWRWGWQYWGLAGSVGSQRTSNYTEGSLAIDVYDNARNAPVWHGVSNKRLANEKPETLKEKISQVVTDVLSKYPDVNQPLVKQES